MKKALKALIWFLALAAILYGGWQGMRFVQARKAAVKEAPKAADEAAPIKVAVKTVRVGSVCNSVWVTGEVRALRSVEVVPKVAGRLERMRLPDDTLIEEGVEVKRGQLVAVIEHNQLEAAVEAAVHSAEAALAVAGAGCDITKVNVADTGREKQRWIELRKGGSGTQRQLDQVVTAHERTQAQLKQAKAGIAQAEAALAQAKVNLDEATIEAPFSGVVSRKCVDEGAFVGPTTPLFRLVDIHQVEITGGVADRRYPHVHVGKTHAEVEVDACPGEKFSGYVARIRPELDRVTRTVAVTIRIANDDGRLKPGMYARIRLVLDERKDVPLVPDEALISFKGETRAYVVNDGKAHVRKVRIGLEEGNLNEVLDGLQPGEKVVVRGHQMLREGTPVEAIDVQEVSAQ